MTKLWTGYVVRQGSTGWFQVDMKYNGRSEASCRNTAEQARFSRALHSDVSYFFNRFPQEFHLASNELVLGKKVNSKCKLTLRLTTHRSHCLYYSELIWQQGKVPYSVYL